MLVLVLVLVPVPVPVPVPVLVLVPVPVPVPVLVLVLVLVPVLVWSRLYGSFYTNFFPPKGSHPLRPFERQPLDSPLWPDPRNQAMCRCHHHKQSRLKQRYLNKLTNEVCGTEYIESSLHLPSEKLLSFIFMKRTNMSLSLQQKFQVEMISERNIFLAVVLASECFSLRYKESGAMGKEGNGTMQARI